MIFSENRLPPPDQVPGQAFFRIMHYCREGGGFAKARRIISQPAIAAR
jgi:hypothetical protein